jgi:formate-dependent nitrite reductase membrane component NrfD
MSAKQDINGKESAKRKFGAILIITDVILFVIYFGIVLFLSIFTQDGKPDSELITPMLYDMWLWILWMGASLIGLTIAEHIMSFIKGKKGVS